MLNKTLLAHPGTQYSHRLAKQLVQQNCLYEFWTGFALAEDALSTQVLVPCFPVSWRQRIANRIIKGLPAKRLRTMPVVEAQALYELYRGKSPEAVFHNRNQTFQEKISTTSIQQVSAVIGFDTSSWILAKRATQMDKAFFLDQSIAHPVVKDFILQKLVRRFPDWQDNLEPRLPIVLACENEEYQLATKIIVASSYTQQTLVSQGISADKIIVNPYGVDLEKFYPSTLNRINHPLRFLFLGPILPRKGIPLLLEAWRSLALKDCELWLVGPIRPQERRLIPELPGLKILGKYPHKDLPDLLRQCDVLVFPSYCEGFAQVLLEALASGLPIITTEATAGPDLIQDGVEGLLIPSGNLDALCEAMKFFIDNPHRLESMSKAARHCAEKFSWDIYGDRWQKILQQFS